MYESILDSVNIDNKSYPRLRQKYLRLRRQIEDKIFSEMRDKGATVLVLVPGTFTYRVNSTSATFTLPGNYNCLKDEQVIEIYELMSEAFEAGGVPRVYLEADVYYDEVESLVVSVENPTPVTVSLPDELIKATGAFNDDLAEVSAKPEEFEAELAAAAEVRKVAKAANSRKLAMAKAGKILEKSGITRQELLDFLEEEGGNVHA